MEYRVDDRGLDAAAFLSFVNQIWPGDYDLQKTERALAKTINIAAYDGQLLVGCLRILTELLVLPQYRRQGVGSHLLRLAREHTPTMLYFGAQPGAEGFYEKNGCRPSLPSYAIQKKGVQ